MKPVCAVEKVIEKNGKNIIVCNETRSHLLPVLRDIQDRKGYISDRDMQEIADGLGIHPVEVYSVVTFYSFLTSKKKGKCIIRVSNCMPNVMSGSKNVIKAFERALKIKLGETTKDGRFTLETTGCIGMCDQAPAIMVNDQLMGKISPNKVGQLIADLKKVRSK